MRQRDSIDLNADVGEGCASDEELVPLVSSVNIACGAHAGDTDTMRRTLELALWHGVAIGAHPGFEDRENFGRKERAIEPLRAARLVLDQTRLLESVAREFGARVRHVKLHGALYTMASRDAALAEAIVQALAEASRQSGSQWVLVALAASALLASAKAHGLPVAAEAFADRTYRSDGTLTSRSLPGAVIADAEVAARQAVRLAKDGFVRTSEGSDLAVEADTICIHGDGPDAISLALRIRDGLQRSGISVRC